MAILGLLLTVLGLVISVASLSITSSVGGRMALVLFGLVVSLVGIVAFVNRAYLKHAVWRRN